MLTGTNPRCLSLLGPSGTGKTLLARCVWKFFDKEGMWYTGPRGANLVHDGRFVDWPWAVKRMKEGDYGPVEDLERRWFNIIDDVGAEHDPSKAGRENLMRIFNARRGKWTLLTSNKSMADFELYEVRLASRLIRDGNEVVELDASVPDFNLRPK